MCSTKEITTETADRMPEPASMPLERLEREITELAAHINAATCRWLLLVGEFDRREGWADWGCKSCVHWLSYRCGLSPSAAREQVRVARRLGALPATRASFGEGELCFSQVRALTRIATEETEQDLIMVARHATAAQLDVLVRAYRGVMDYELGASRPEDERRYVRCHHDDDGGLVVQARLPAEEGALLLAALEAGRDAIRAGRTDPAGQPGGQAADQDAADDPTAPGAGGASAEATHIGDSRADGRERSDGSEAAGEPAAVSNADALVLMAETLLSSGPAERSGGESYQVVVHVDAATLAQDGADGGPCQLEHGGALHPETARRLACDASLVRILERDGRPLSIGRKTRSVPPALRRALRSRDPVCRFPGCPQRRFLHAHHVDHWARGGRTDLSNLVQLCSHHHRLVHEGGYTLERGSNGSLRFRRPDGQAIAPTPRRPTGRPDHLRRWNTQRGLDLTHETCVPCIYAGDKFDLHWVVANLAEGDSRLPGTPPWSSRHKDDRPLDEPEAQRAKFAAAHNPGRADHRDGQVGGSPIPRPVAGEHRFSGTSDPRSATT
jgi:hypothetical protein